MMSVTDRIKNGLLYAMWAAWADPAFRAQFLTNDPARFAVLRTHARDKHEENKHDENTQMFWRDCAKEWWKSHKTPEELNLMMEIFREWVAAGRPEPIAIKPAKP